MKLFEFQAYYNEHRVHAALNGRPPASPSDERVPRASPNAYRWQSHCRGLYHTPIAA
jgi:transposase InsO family protein